MEQKIILVCYFKLFLFDFVHSDFLLKLILILAKWICSILFLLSLESGTRCGSAKSRVTKDLKSNLGDVLLISFHLSLTFFYFIEFIFTINSLFVITLSGPDGRVDKTVWKTIQLIMQDSQKFCEFMNNYNWCKGVSNDVLHTVVMFFAPGEEIPLSARTQNNRTTSQKGDITNSKAKIWFTIP